MSCEEPGYGASSKSNKTAWLSAGANTEHKTHSTAKNAMGILRTAVPPLLSYMHDTTAFTIVLTITSAVAERCVGSFSPLHP